MTVLTRRSIETDAANNVLTVNVGVVRVLELEVASTIDPPQMEGVRLRNYKASSKTLQGYGPVQILTIMLENGGKPTIGNAEVSVMYPVQYLGQDTIYIADILGSTNCTEDTNRAVNHRKLRDIYNPKTVPISDKFTSIPLQECGADWKCVRLTCSLSDIRPSRERSLVVKTYLNAEAASHHPNITYSVSFNATLRDLRSVYKDRTVGQQVSSTVEVIPGIVGTLWYIVAGVGGGSLLLVILVVILIRCGFFSRKERDEIKLMKDAALAATQPVSVSMKPPEHVPVPPTAFES